MRKSQKRLSHEAHILGGKTTNKWVSTVYIKSEDQCCREGREGGQGSVGLKVGMLGSGWNFNSDQGSCHDVKDISEKIL